MSGRQGIKIGRSGNPLNVRPQENPKKLDYKPEPETIRKSPPGKRDVKKPSKK